VHRDRWHVVTTSNLHLFAQRKQALRGVHAGDRWHVVTTSNLQLFAQRKQALRGVHATVGDLLVAPVQLLERIQHVPSILKNTLCGQ
jgi:hypothetical protein